MVWESLDSNYFLQEHSVHPLSVLDHKLVLSRRLLVELRPNHVDREDSGLGMVGLVGLLVVGLPGHHPVFVVAVGIPCTIQTSMMLTSTPLLLARLERFTLNMGGGISGLVQLSQLSSAFILDSLFFSLASKLGSHLHDLTFLLG